MPDEVNIDDLIDLPNEQERVQKLQVPKKSNNQYFWQFSRFM